MKRILFVLGALLLFGAGYFTGERIALSSIHQELIRLSSQVGAVGETAEDARTAAEKASSNAEEAVSSAEEAGSSASDAEWSASQAKEAAENLESEIND